MCRTQEIRFVCYMEHENFDGRLAVGRICAEKMSGDYADPLRREKELQKKAGRRSRWLSRKWKLSCSGNPYLTADGVDVLVCLVSRGFNRGKWGYRIGG
jgi:hypothetical protein